MSESESTLVPYSIQSKNTKFFVTSTRKDQDGQEVNTTQPPPEGSIPVDGILTLNPIIRGPITRGVLIQGVSGLYVSLKGTNENTKLTWSKAEYHWTISLIAPESYVVTPDNGADLYWFDEFNVGVGDHVEVRAGKHITGAQNQWLFTPLLRR